MVAGRESYATGHLPGAVYADLNRDLSAPPTAARVLAVPVPLARVPAARGRRRRLARLPRAARRGESRRVGEHPVDQLSPEALNAALDAARREFTEELGHPPPGGTA